MEKSSTLDFSLDSGRVFLFNSSIDGVVIFAPICIFGTFVNSFMYSILNSKVELATSVNSMIKMETLFRIFLCAWNFGYKAWILTISPLLGISNLPTPFQCYLGGLFPYIVGIGTSIFTLQTNILRYLYIKTVTTESARIKKILMNPYLERHLTVIGLGIVAVHGISTLLVEPNQFFFDQACLRPHEKLNKQTFGTRLHNLLLITYNLVSITISILLYRFVKSESNRLEGSLGQGNLKARKSKKNLYTAGTGLAHILVMVMLGIILTVPLSLYRNKITTSLQAFMTEMIGFVTHGIVSPCIIFWASSEARKPAVEAYYKMKCKLTKHL